MGSNSLKSAVGLRCAHPTYEIVGLRFANPTYATYNHKSTPMLGAHVKKRGHAAFQMFDQVEHLFNLGFFAQALLVGTQALLVELLGDLGFEFFKRW